jgi:hypothetical protein
VVFVRVFVNRFLLRLLEQLALLVAAAASFAGLSGGALDSVIFSFGALIAVVMVIESMLSAAEMAVKEYGEVKQKQELEALGLYCSNCAHLKRKMFGRLGCGLTGQATTEGGGCADHSDYSRRRYRPVRMAIPVQSQRLPSS